MVGSGLEVAVFAHGRVAEGCWSRNNPNAANRKIKATRPMSSRWSLEGLRRVISQKTVGERLPTLRAGMFVFAYQIVQQRQDQLQAHHAIIKPVENKIVILG